MQQQNRLMIIFIDLLGGQIDQMGGYNKCLFSLVPPQPDLTVLYSVSVFLYYKWVPPQHGSACFGKHLKGLWRQLYATKCRLVIYLLLNCEHLHLFAGLCGAISLVAGFLKWQRHVESHYNLKIGVLAYGSTADFFFHLYGCLYCRYLATSIIGQKTRVTSYEIGYYITFSLHIKTN